MGGKTWERGGSLTSVWGTFARAFFGEIDKEGKTTETNIEKPPAMNPSIAN